MTAIYRVGERVDGLYDENTDDMWYPGRVRCVHLDEIADAATFEVLYDDGEVETNVRPEFLRQHVPGTICVGTRVLCRYDGGDEFYPGQVSGVHENGRYTIAYDDGEVEEDVPLDHITEPTDEEDVETGAEEPAEEKKVATDNVAPHQPEQQEQEDIEMEEADDFPRNNVDDANNNAQENDGSVDRDSKPDKAKFHSPKPELPQYGEPTQYTQNEDPPDETLAGVSAEREYILDSLQLLEKRLGDAASTKSVLSTLVKQMRAYPQVTADLVHDHDGERLIIDALKFHQSHAVIQCYGFVLLRRLCFLCVQSTQYLLRNGIVELVIQAMNAFAEDAILQASACGALAVFTRVHTGLNILIEFQVAQLVLSTLIYHKTYSVHTRQVHYYACEVLLELCELDDLQTLNLLCGEQEEDFTGDMSPISLLLFLLRQGLSLDDKKACCAVGSLLMCLAASGRRAAALILSLNGLAELSTVMARYPTEASIQKYSATASKQIALCSVRQSPTKRIKDTATEILREAASLENTPRDKPPTKRKTSRRTTGTGKRKSNPTTSYGAPIYPRGAAYSSSSPYRSTQGFSKVSSPYGQLASGFHGDTNSFSYSVRDYHTAATAPQQPSSLVILDGTFGGDSGFGLTNKRKQLSKEDRQSELFDAYGIQGIPSNSNGRPYGTKRAQLKAHLASAESTWATPQHIPPARKPYSSRSDHLDHGPAYSHRDFMSSQQNRWDYDNNEAHNPAYDSEPRQPRGAKRKKKTPGVRTAFQVKVENENQLRVSKEARSAYPSPQRLGVATKRAAKARQKRISAIVHSSLTGRSNNVSSESLNDYATQLFQDNASRAGAGIVANSKLTPREKEEIRERERLSFAEKLHKMIDKAKSTLANGNTTSVPAVDAAPRPQKSTKTTRKPRELSTTPSEEKRPQSKKTHAAVSSTPKYATFSPREAAETRPAKPPSGASKRSDAPSAPVVSRPKPTVSRTLATPKATTEQKPPAAAKSTKVAPTKPLGKREAEKTKESGADEAPAEVAPVSNTPVIEGPPQVEANTVAPEVSSQLVEESIVPMETKAVEQVEPAALNGDDGAKVGVDVMPSDVATKSQVETDSAGNTDAVRNDASVEEVATKEDAAPEPPAEAIVEATPELAEPSEEASVLPLEEPGTVLGPTDDQPSEGSATVAAMYGDEFDDDGGDDEDMTGEAGAQTDDTLTPVIENSDPPTDIPLQESKSGAALYNDGYDEFDEDESPDIEETEAEDATAEAVDGEISDVIASQPPEIESDPAVVAPEGESKQLAGEEAPAAAEEATSVPNEGEEGDEAPLHDANVDKKSGAVAVEPAESEPEAIEQLQSGTMDIDKAPEAAPSDPVVEEEQEHVNLNTDPVTEPCDENDVENDAEPVDAATVKSADISAPSDNAEENAPDGDTSEDAGKHEAEPAPDASDFTPVIEPAETEGVVEDAEPSAQPAALDDETSVENPPGETVASTNPATDEAPQQDGEEPTEETETTAQPDEPLTNDESVSSLKQDEESKNLLADSSVASIQSAAYDEDNFDVEEAEPSEAIEVSSSVAPVEETSVDEVTENAEVNTPSEPLEPVEDVPTAPEYAKGSKPEEPTVEDEAPAATPETYGDEDFDCAVLEDAANETTAESIPEPANDPSEQQQPENSNATSTPEPEVMAEPSLAATEIEVPHTTAQEDTVENIQEETVENPQESVDVEPVKYDDDVQADNTDEAATEDDSVSAAESATGERTAADPTTDTLEGETSKITIPTEVEFAQEDAENADVSTPAATYDDDDFDNGAEEEAAPSAATEDSGLPADHSNDEVSKNEELPVQPSEQPNGEAGDTEDVETINTDDPVAVEETSPVSEPQATSDSVQLHESPTEDTAASSPVADVATSQVTPKPEVAAENPSEDVGEHIELSTEAEANVDPASDEVGNPVSEVATSESEPPPTTTNEQLGDSEPESTADAVQAENVPELEAQEDKPVELDGAALSEPELDRSAATTEITGQMPDYTQGDDVFDADSPEYEPVACDITVVADTSAEPLVDATQEETEYGDADFDETENDTAAGVVSESDPVKSDSGVKEDITPTDSVSTNDPLPVEISPADTANEEAADLPAEVNEATQEVSETASDTNDDVEVEADEQARVDQTSVDHESSDAAIPEAEINDEPPVSSSDAAAYEEDFPDDDSPETQEDAAVDIATTSTENEAAANDSAPVEGESTAMDSSPTNEVSENVGESTQPSSDVRTAPDSPSKDEQYEDGFDDDNTAPTIPESGSGSAVDVSSAAEADPIVNVGTDVPESSTVAESAEENVVADSDQPHEDQSGMDELNTNSAESAAQDEVGVKAEEENDVNVVEAPVETPMDSEPVTSEAEVATPESVGHVPMEPEAATHGTGVSEVIEPEGAASEVVEPEDTATDIVDPVESKSDQAEPVESETVQSDVVEPEGGEAEEVSYEAAEAEVVEPDNVEPQPSEEPTTVEPEATGSEAAEPDAVEPETAEPGTVESGTADDSAPVQEPTLETSIADPSPVESAAPEADDEELQTEPLEASIVAESVVSEGENVSATEEAVKVLVDTPTETNDQSSTEEGGAASEAKEVASQVEEASTKEDAADASQSEEPVEDTTSASVEAPAAEISVEEAPDELQEPVQSEAESTQEVDQPNVEAASPDEENVDDAIGSRDVAPQDYEAAGESQSTSEVEVKDEPVDSSPDATTQEPAEPTIAPTEEALQTTEDQTSLEPNYTEADAMADESPDKNTPTDDTVLEERPSNQDTTEAPSEESTVQENVDVPEPSQELAIKVEAPQAVEIAAEFATEAPKTEDQYDDDEGYNEFDDQGNETTPVSTPTVEVPAPTTPVATEALGTEDEYENDDYGEEEKPVETPRADPVAPASTRSEPPVSAREEEIQEDAEEEAYADYQDEYNNEYEDDDTPTPVPTNSSLKKDKSSPQAEASADEYEDDNEEEDYAEDEIEDTSPPKPAPTQPTSTPAVNKSDDEMDEEVGYDSEEYADSDG